MKAAHNEHLFIEDVKKGYFRIDEDGRIWRIAIKGCVNKFIKIPEREMKNLNSRGYIQMSLRKNGKTYFCRAHRIVWTYFNGEIPDDKEINHKNGVKTDNRPENLELVISSENKKHAYRTGLKIIQKGEKHYKAKLTENDIKEIRKRCSSGETQRSVAKDFNITSPHVCLIVNRKRWAHV